MGKEMSVDEVIDTINECANIDEPIIVKRKNKEDLVIISMEEYKRKILLSELTEKVAEGEEDIEYGNIDDAKKVLKELRSKYGY